MGTSNPYGGPAGRTPLVPSWLGSDGGGMGPDGSLPTSQAAPPSPQLNPSLAPSVPPIPNSPAFPTIPAPAARNRFAAARNNLSRFARSGGRDRASLGR